MKALLIFITLVANLSVADNWLDVKKLTSVGPEKNRNFDVTESAIAINSNNNSYMVVWEGNDFRTDTATGENEIFGQIHNEDGSTITTETIRISFMGVSLSLSYDGRKPDIVYNPNSNEYLVVWYGDHNQNGLIEGEFEIFAQRINADNGELIGTLKRISDMGPVSNRAYDAFNPHVTYNTQDQLYLVVWHGEEGNAASPLGSFEIYGQLLNNNAIEVGDNDFKISDMGPANDPDYNAFSPVAAYNSTNNEFLIAWYGEDERDGRLPGEFEIYAQRINASNGSLIGADSTSVSFVGLNGDIARAAKFPDVTYNKEQNEYFIVWSADDSKDGHVGNEFEIYGQILDANAQEIGKNDFLISEMGPIGLNSFDAFRPKVEYLSASGQYVTVWRGDDNVDGEFEIHAQRLNAANQVRIGKSSERLSHAGIDNNLLYDARRVDIAVNASNSEVIVIWEQEDESATQIEGEFEVFARKLQTSDFLVNSTMTGSWFDVNRDGEGYIVEILPNNGVLVTWFTYLPDQAEQAWILGTGTIKNNRVTLTLMQTTAGGTFGPNFDSTTIQNIPWGELSLEFDSCNSAIVNYKSSNLAYGYGDHNLSRLTNLSGLDCNAQSQNNDRLNGLTAAWFDPSHNGEGWFLEYLGNNTVLMYWFTYDDIGQQKWFISVGQVDDQDVITFSDTTITDGTSFGTLFNAADINRLPWGSVEMIINNCQSITINYNSTLPIYGQGQLEAIPLTSIAGIECIL